MTPRIRRGSLAAATGALALALAAPLASQAQPARDAGIAAPRGSVAFADFDIVRASIGIERDQAVFRIQVAGQAGATRPRETGRFAGSEVHAYVWPTTLDSGLVGFDPGQGILALAVTFHPDFDDGAPGRERNRHIWHSHWVVLGPDPACGPAALKVQDLPRDRHPRVPGDWPGVPLMISSPDLPPVFSGDAVEVRVPMADLPGLREARFDGVTAGLKVNGDLHAPLLSVAQVLDVASGNLSLPGRVAPGSGTR
ncbi:hypothetical protein [Falsiroseomonas oryzae]|uniref:hypothetical protein n=1 Tax=Falsiroseomonas oryzae TaxID=2766473 RepID=UPI0022EABAAE|nr:hypothetical protein [Roseomonas sp. MO-31]